jgi:hypothetical protein
MSVEELKRESACTDKNWRVEREREGERERERGRESNVFAFARATWCSAWAVHVFVCALLASVSIVNSFIYPYRTPRVRTNDSVPPVSHC